MTTLLIHLENTDFTLGEATVELNRDIHAAFVVLKSYHISTSSTMQASTGTDINDFLLNLDIEWAVSGRYSVQGTSKRVTGIPLFYDLNDVGLMIPNYDYPVNVRRKHIPKVFKIRISNGDGTATSFWPATTGPTPTYKITLMFEIKEIIPGV